MKRIIEQQLVDAAPQNRGNDAFVARTMQAIKQLASHETFTRAMRKTNVPKKERLYMRLKHLPVPALAALIITVLLLTSGTIYAAIRFAPDLIKILGKTTNETGRVEYSVPSFADCAVRTDSPRLDKFQLRDNAPKLSDDEVQKIIQARCEMKWLEEFTRETWKPYGDRTTWQTGDNIYYTRQDVIGSLTRIDKNHVSVTRDIGGKITADYTPVAGQSVEAYANGRKIPVNQLKSGDVVSSIVRVTETYHERCTTVCDSKPRDVGLVALIKLSLPAEYYGIKQSYLTDVPQCRGNEGEYCPQTFPQIDVFPRDGGEGARNPVLNSQQNTIMREIIGKVTKLTADSLVLQTTRGTEYSVTITPNGFSDYNSKYANAYRDYADATLRIGNTVSVFYYQSASDDAHTIEPDQVSRINLLYSSINPKQTYPKKY